MSTTNSDPNGSPYTEKTSLTVELAKLPPEIRTYIESLENDLKTRLTFNVYKDNKWHDMEIVKPDTMTDDEFHEFSLECAKTFASLPFIEPLLK